MPAARRRLIAHLDMDAFYASVELLRRPDLVGLPVVIGGGRAPGPGSGGESRPADRRLRDYVGRGVVTTSTYEARALGVHSGMGIMKAAQRAGHAILLPTDFDAYRRCSRAFKTAVRDLAPQVEDRGIDEIYIDLSDVATAQADAGRAIGLQLKRAVHAATGLTCSVGVAPNKLLAKICSELDKPDGLTLLDAADVPTRVWPLAAKKINGIGPKAAEKLAGFGLHTIGDVAGADAQWLVEHFGKHYGAWLHEAAHGRDERAVVTHSEPKSISRETTFERDLHAVRDRSELGRIFTHLCVQLAGDLSRQGYASRTIGVKLRFEDFRSVTRDLSLGAHTLDPGTIRQAAGACLKRVDLSRRLRLLGVRAGALARIADLVAPAPAAAPAPTARGALQVREREASYTLPLFDAPPPAR